MSKKRKVSTRARKMYRRIKKIKDFLKNYPEGITPSIIAFNTEIPESSVKSLLPKIPEVEKIRRGLYHLVEKEGDGAIFSWNFHNCILTYQTKSFDKENIKEEYLFGYVNYYFEIGKESKKATLRIISDHPINISSIHLAYILFSHLVNKFTSEKPTTKKVSLSSIEFNKDYSNLRIDGPSCIILDSLFAQYKIYQKENCVREEVKTKVIFNLDSLFSVLLNKSKSFDIDNKLFEMEKNQKDLIKHYKNISQFVKKLLVKIDGRLLKC